MPFRESSIPLRDIVASIDAIESFTKGMDFEAFRADGKTIAAVERKLQPRIEKEIPVDSERKTLYIDYSDRLQGAQIDDQ